MMWIPSNFSATSSTPVASPRGCQAQLYLVENLSIGMSHIDSFYELEKLNLLPLIPLFEAMIKKSTFQNRPFYSEKSILFDSFHLFKRRRRFSSAAKRPIRDGQTASFEHSDIEL
jgi:hypothetical protein